MAVHKYKYVSVVYKLTFFVGPFSDHRSLLDSARSTIFSGRTMAIR